MVGLPEGIIFSPAEDPEGSGTHPACYRTVIGFLSQFKATHSWWALTSLHIISKLRKRGAIPLLHTAWKQIFLPLRMKHTLCQAQFFLSNLSIIRVLLLLLLLLTYLLTNYLLSFLLIYLLTYLLNYLHTYFHTYIHTYILTYILT